MITVTTRDHETGDEETMELEPGKYIVVCGPGRWVSYEQVHANGTAVVTIKRDI